MLNSEVCDVVNDIDGNENYLRKNYEALIYYLTINGKLNSINEDNNNLENEIMKIKESTDFILSNKEQLTS